MTSTCESLSQDLDRFGHSPQTAGQQVLFLCIEEEVRFYDRVSEAESMQSGAMILHQSMGPRSF